MAENRSPDIPKLNLATLASASKRSRSKTPGIAEPKPMTGDRIFNVFNTNGEGSGGLTVDVDTTRMQLISPPPEEMLILQSARKRNTPFTPSLLADNSNEEGSMTTAKRKRQQQTPKPSRTTTTEVAPSTSKQWAEATPNPRLRKQARRSTEPEEVLEDVEMESPTRNAFISTMTTPIPLPSTPSRPSGKAKLKKVLLQSPHTANPDADYIPPVRLVTSPGPEEEEGDELGPMTMGSVVRRKLLAAKGSRRSATPIPAYEPPKDVFTPPREVVMQPPPSTARRLKGKGRQSSVAREAETAVKQEMPDIDLKAPMPPPSPGDDPLLLSSDIEEIECLPPPVVQHKTPKMSTKKKGKGDTGKKSTVKKSASSKKKAGRTPGSSKKTTLLQSTTSTAIAAEVVLQEEEEEGDELLNRGPLDFDLPPSSPPPASDAEDEDNFDWTQGAVVEDQYIASTEDSMMHMDPADAEVEPVAVGLLDFDSALKNHTSNSAAAGWSSDEEEGDQDQDAEGTGNYTGRWRLMKVRTKTDPPSEATAYRMEEWGRPVSPFPGVRRLHLDPEKDVVLPEESAEEPSTPRNEAVGLGLEESARQEAETPRPEMTILPPSEAEVEEEEAREEEEVMRMSMEPEEEEPEQEQEDHDDVQQEAEPEPFPVTPANNRAFEFTSSHYVPLNDVEQATQDAVNDDDDGNEEDLSDLDLGMVKIVSADPRAAARAAAILKQYDYECFTKLTMKQQRNKDKRRYSSLDDFSQESRRRNLLGSGVGKGDVAERERKRRRATLGMGVIGDRVVIPGSPSVTLPELLDQAEKEVLNHSPVKVSAVATPPPTRASLDAKRLFETPVRKEVSPTVVVFPVWNQTYEGEERPWTKEEWKVLDSCLTDERLGYSPHAQELKPVDEIDVDNVVERFVTMAGGDDVVYAYGSSWTRDLLQQRVRALQKKQRSGNVAPPTTPIVARSVSPRLSLGGKKRRASMEVPDFTPLGRRAPPPRKSRPSLPQPVTENAPFSTLARRKSIPATLLAPRYSHLLHEARAISGEVADMSMQQDTQGGDTEEQPLEPAELPTAEPLVDDETSVEFPTVESTPQPSESRDLRYQTPGTTFGKKLKGIFFSYLPTLSKTAPPPGRKPAGAQRGLPLPPPEVLNKSRGPVETPERPPLPKVPHPKELVELHPAPLPKPSMIPRPKQPQRLVQLNPVQPPPPPPGVIPRPRRSSGSSVKDLVKSFEEMKDREEQERPPSSLGKAAGMRSLGKVSKPSWKP
ncbi:hypothetical protein EST38_g14051 [Candolleomyces aberdarensis]|uniref:Uncharacterized protein n=1 Tax=Candolleomyces aberdarensis TaxID=2316362 RepID=A0A4Q2D0Q0_9AGAR|nr:hypothetical protein EST38_g14051 [Candolleomyces aberdarensis]